jgi:DNA-binding NtrC family response regulator
MSKARTTVLITGESGTGKTMIARAMHYESDRSQGPFIEMTCGALTETLLEAELFGVEAGAFTGATHQKEGKFEAADGGTIFLDEIANASPSLQVKLLRLIQDSCFERVGGTETIVTDTRVILATNVDLAREVADGRFREDLYYRVNVVPIHVPPLRDRRKDIPDLVNHLVRKHAHASEKAIGDVSPAAMQILTAHAWPGNVRQLENIVERAVVLARGDTVEVSELPSELLTTAPSAPAHAGKTDVIIPLKKALEEPERQIILRAIEYAGGNRDEAAKLLGINRSTLFYKLRKLKVKVPAATAG